MLLIISTCADKLSELEFVRPIERLVPVHKTVHCTKITPADIATADKIIIAGTALKDFDYLKADFSWLRTTTRPVLGICAGMQVIATALGMPLEDFVTIGPRPVQVVKECALISGAREAYFLHTKTACGFETLAVTDGKPCMFKIPCKEMYGCIFHPEVLNERIIARFAA